MSRKSLINKLADDEEACKKENYFFQWIKVYGQKVKVSILPNGKVIGCSKKYPGSTSDFEIFEKRSCCT